ncbi:MAG: hypothetical protein COT39_02860 [Parcubacteria group bacterium CG08_land_8_20_14_0_20_48_21]|nr:MAG: hypothetical protein COT39_02860 [Parcubacteria group bacterium CG08_land_8_20_14_0_20_48_21]PIW79181.1 MAG: hypothetical protein COZ99_02575 [Parcubacteria group bacterium CG_4_8_14_3_um_filter_48_16]PIY77829.1 MAG: hypothetical protein COY83_03240 [Parcubacteria group bacterium CG_4_10_14_0_8_um_filter_48_154]PIZ78018.1 MAG: hypothetical protein COY03_00870 [bacterium CG_4_10_14_0_2_um_filter_48_144]PJC39856.1 MAG: hypothetical protein CO043_02125 [Parcubacteria group bacterium CG_4_9
MPDVRRHRFYKKPSTKRRRYSVYPPMK